jgi:HSP20 family molecular chaperone IbpA
MARKVALVPSRKAILGPARRQQNEMEGLKMAEKSTAVQTALEPTSLSRTEPETLSDRINRIHQSIARRAYEIFQNDEWSWGHDLDHWFKAEAELLHPTHVSVTESDQGVNVEAEVPGFSANELQVNLDPQRLTISGKRETSKEDRKKGKTVYQETCSSELLRVVDLPVEVDPAKTTATLKNGVLSLIMPKGAQAKASRIEVKAA